MRFRNSLIVAACAVFAALVAVPVLADLSVEKQGIQHLYVFEKGEESLATYQTLIGPLTATDVVQMNVAPAANRVDALGEPCSRVTLVPEDGKRAGVNFVDLDKELRELVIDEEVLYLCNEKLPNHDEMPYPPD